MTPVVDSGQFLNVKLIKCDNLLHISTESSHDRDTVSGFFSGKFDHHSMLSKYGFLSDTGKTIKNILI